MRPTVTIPARAKNQVKKGPMSLLAKECTLAMSPERVRNVPNIVNRKVTQIKSTFQTRNMLRRSWMIVECTYAAAVNQGRHAAFSTGSHAQKPPHPPNLVLEQVPQGLDEFELHPFG